MMSELFAKYMPATLTTQVTEALKLLKSLNKVTWPAVPKTGDLWEHIR
jgi:hypothetical protein